MSDKFTESMEVEAVGNLSPSSIGDDCEGLNFRITDLKGDGK